MVCRNICEKIYSKIVVGESHYFVGKKYCRRCECYFITKSIFCQCCGMQLRGSPAERECREKVNRKKKKQTKIRDCIEVSLAAWLNLNTVFLTMV
jgi:hypothetical protein